MSLHGVSQRTLTGCVAVIVTVGDRQSLSLLGFPFTVSEETTHLDSLIEQ